ncbi:DUF6099 family protein [Streptomyces lunaelactis]|uniref:DUF6099 family protein n=1 Tax=Streptomyces lunaelactis TaxID=1535768 RepID=UPI0020C81846|nr:DUF6099 family protein [Streptomyces lunaelactis]
MDAERLIGVSRRALAQSRAVPDIVAEAWQAQALAQAIGGRLVLAGPPELRGEARGLSEIGGRACGVLDHPMVRSGGVRAAQLSEVADPRGTLTGLSALLGDVGIALVGVACATDEEGLYWQCIEAIDAADESNDRVRGMLRRLSVRESDRPPDTVRGRAGPMAAAVSADVPKPPGASVSSESADAAEAVDSAAGSS